MIDQTPPIAGGNGVGPLGWGTLDLSYATAGVGLPEVWYCHFFHTPCTEIVLSLQGGL